MASGQLAHLLARPRLHRAHGGPYVGSVGKPIAGQAHICSDAEMLWQVIVPGGGTIDESEVRLVMVAGSPVVPAGLLLPERFSRCGPQPGCRSGYHQG